MSILKREDILNAVDIKSETVSVPEWGGEVYVRGMTGAERDRFEGSIIEMKSGGKQSFNMENVRAKLCQFCICDENGKRLFAENDVAALAKKSALALQRVYDVAAKLSGLGEKEIEELADGLKNDRSGDSLSDSPVTSK